MTRLPKNATVEEFAAARIAAEAAVAETYKRRIAQLERRFPQMVSVTTYVYEPSDLFDFEGRAVQVLVTNFPDGKQTLAMRSRPEHTWGPPELPVIAE